MYNYLLYRGLSFSAVLSLETPHSEKYRTNTSIAQACCTYIMLTKLETTYVHVHVHCTCQVSILLPRIRLTKLSCPGGPVGIYIYMHLELQIRTLECTGSNPKRGSSVGFSFIIQCSAFIVCILLCIKLLKNSSS